MKTSKLKYNPSNPRTILPEKLEKLKTSISEFPEMMELRPIVYEPETMIVLGGNQRLVAIKALDMKEIPDNWVIAADKLNDAQKKEFILKDNIPVGEWDFEMLQQEFSEFNLEDIGIDIPMPSKFIGSDSDDDEESFTEQELNKTNIKLGDVITIGPHKLICGSSTDIATVSQLSNNHTLTLTDPPYSVNYESIQRRTDKPSRESTNSFYKDPPAEDVLKFIGLLKSDLLVFTYPLAKHFHLLAELTQEWDMMYELIWVKNTFAFNMHRNYQQQHEMIFIFRKKKHGKTVMNVPKNQGTVFTIDRPLANKEHPTIKPTELYEKLVEFHTKPGDIVFEPFSGSGTTMLACENKKRICEAVEIVPEYCQATINKMLRNYPEMSVEINGSKYEPVT